MSGVLENLEKKAVEVLGTGISWSTFENPAEVDVYSKLEYFRELSAEIREMYTWVYNYEWTWNVLESPEGKDALLAWEGIRTGILSKDSIINAALAAGAERIGASEAPLYEREVLRAFFSQMVSLAMRGYEIHHELVLQLSKVSAFKIYNNADLVFFTARALNRLQKLGALEYFRKPSNIWGTDKVGAVPVAYVVAITVGSVAALCVMAWFVSKMTTILGQWELANVQCLAAAQNPDNKELAEACRKAQENFHNSAPQGSPMAPLNTLAVFAGVGVLVLAVGYGILPNLKGK